MIGLVIVSQGRLAIELRAALEHVVGPQHQLELVSIESEVDIEHDRANLIEAIDRVDTGDGVIIVADMFGAPASDLAVSMLDRRKLDVIAGVNVPSLVKLASIRGKCSLAEAVAAAQESGRKHISYCPESAARPAQ